MPKKYTLVKNTCRRTIDSNMQILWILLILSVSYPAGRCQDDCTISIVKSKVKVNSTTADISWESSDECGSGASSKIKSYQVYYQHQGWLACDDNRKDNFSRGTQKVEVNRWKLHGLHPNSKYNVTVIAQGRKVNARTSEIVHTEAALPETRPKKGSFSALSDRSLKFHWESPSQDECQKQNGRQNGFNVTLMGDEVWANGEVPLQTRHTSGGNINAFNILQAFTSYKLRVYTNNYGNLINPDVFLEIHGKTKETTPQPPTNISATPNSAHSLHLKWYPAYPPTGFITKYEIREGVYRGDSTEPEWTKPHTVELKNVDSFKCAGQLRGSRHANIGYGSKPVCFVVDSLQANTSYAFQINTWNNDTGDRSQKSIYSKIIKIQTQLENQTYVPLDTTQTTLLPIPVPTIRKDNGRSTGQNTAIIIVCLAAGAVLLGIIVTAMVYKLKVVKLTQQLSQSQLENRRDSKLSNLSSVYNPNSTITTHTSDLSYLASIRTTASSIQSRRLPEPPPEDKKKQNAEYSEAYEMPSYLSMATSLQRSHSPKIIEEELEEEQNDIDGYLRPTFPPNRESSPMRTPSRQASGRSRQASGRSQPVSQEADSDYVSEGEKNPSSHMITADNYVEPDVMIRQNSYIPPESYVSPSQLNQWGDERQYLRSNDTRDQYLNKSNSSSKSHSPSTPLILSDIVGTEV